MEGASAFVCGISVVECLWVVSCLFLCIVHVGKDILGCLVLQVKL